jgi:hypothetical protein
MSLKKNKLIRKISSPAIFFYASLWLIVLLVIGTVIQKDIGLYRAQETYFSAWFISYEFIYLPAGRTTLTIVFINLLFQFLFMSAWSIKKIGLHITHFGAILLLCGGFLTAYFSSEGSMEIKEGGRSSTFRDYHKLQLSLVDESQPNKDIVTAVNELMLYGGSTINNLPFGADIKVLSFYRNCDPRRRKEGGADNLKGLSKNFSIFPIPLDKQDERNRAGIVLELTGLSAEVNGIYTLVEEMEPHQHFMVGDKQWRMELEHKYYKIPFEIELIDFEKKVYPGTAKAKSYKSDVFVHDKGVKRKSIVEMNAPMRLHGYTFFQSSFTQSKDGESTIFTVVKNYGRMFPYIASIIICIGLMIHCFLLLPKLIKKGQ